MQSNVWASIDTTPESNLMASVTGDIAPASNGDDLKITSFKVEQRIVNLKSNNTLNIGGFANGDANISKLQSRYMMVMLSNKYNTIKDSQGNIIRKRFGYGYGFTLSVSDIKAKVGFNYGFISASAAMNLMRAAYELNVFAVASPTLIAYMPTRTGDFSNTAYNSLIDFFAKAKESFTTMPPAELYPIEIMQQVSVDPESADVRSIYLGVRAVADGLTLKKAIEKYRDANARVNENVVQFIYTYFNLDNAYAPPGTEQKQNAANWLKCKYNKIDEVGITGDTWVAIDPALENGKFVVLSALKDAEKYQPHKKPTNWATRGKQLDDQFQEVSMDFSSTFKLTSLVQTSAKFNTLTMTRNISLYADVTDDSAGSEVIETRYGVGVRINIHISNIEFGTQINYASIGAASEMGYANVEFEITGLGISDPSFLEVLPGPLVINQNSMDELNEAFEAIKKKLAGIDVSKLEPQPFMIRVNKPDKVDPTLNAQAYVFGVKQIADRKKMKDAINEGAKLRLDKEFIVKAYNDTQITDPDETPSRDDRKEAEVWLG
jgi:hypothetical protein